MNLDFTPATRSEHKARVALIGPTGAGKTWTALEWAETLADGGKVGVIDTENGSAALYADRFKFDTAPWAPPYDAAKLAAAISKAGEAFDVLVVDSLTHFWQGDGGVLDVVEQEGARTRNQFAGWKKGTPLWRGLLDALIFAPCHVIVTMRSKMDYVQTKDSDGRAKVEKLGMAPVARNDVEYEFTVVGEMDTTHRLAITKSRCSALADRSAAAHQSNKLAEEFATWLTSAPGEQMQRPTTTQSAGQLLFARCAATKGTPVADELREFAKENGREVKASAFDADPLWAARVAALLNAQPAT